MSRIAIGTAGWSYADWEGIVYPSPRGRGFHPLEYLARYIDCVEINSTFYRPASAFMAASWVRRVAAYPAFLFAVKLHQAFTHEPRTLDPAATEVFKRGLEPIAAAGRLAALLIQFPWSFGFDERNLAYLEDLLRAFSDYPAAVEVRQAAWDDPRTFALLREHRTAFVNIDQPRIGRSLGPTAVVTRPSFSYVRLHGRNAENWFKPGAGRDARYDYLYAKDELADWVKRIKDLAASSQSVYIITNNHYRGQALANALQIKNMTTGRKLEVPEGLLRQYPVLEEIVRRIKTGRTNLFDDLEDETPGPGKDGPDGLVGK
ncbi:MAG: DUF72 domain-containing protein [Acidobacteriota bacterium]|nr:DUF72 domain-containing protein [Acidobacteriota bacterium]